MLRFSALAALVPLAACSFEDTTPPEAQVLCASDDDCALDQRCGGGGRCVAADDDVTPPAITSITVDPPALSSGVARIVIEANEPLADAAPTLSSIGAPLPTPAFEGVEGARATLLVDASALAEGLYAIDAVTLSDRAGNTATRRVASAALLVDKTVPTLVNVTVTPASVADVPGLSTAVVTFLSTEPLADAHATLGALDAPCALDDNGLAYVCTLDLLLALGTPDGENVVAIDASDVAGNSTSASAFLSADTAAPRVVEDSVSVTLDPAGPATAASVCEPGTSIAIALVLDENPAAVSLTLDPDGLALPLSVTVDGRRVSGLVTAPDGIAEGAYPIALTTSDAVGHEATTTLTLPAPHDTGLRCQSTVGSGCEHPGRDCLDYDGDGAFAIEASCLLGSDCSDIDPTAFPGAPEIPGDGRANGCATDPEIPIDDAHGVFVALAGDDLGTGTALAPAASITRALALLTEERGFLFVEAGTSFPSPDFDQISSTPHFRGIVGGLARDAATWRRTDPAGVTELVCDVVCDTPEHSVIDGVRVTGGSVVLHDRSVLVRSELTGATGFAGSTVAARSRVHYLNVFGNAVARLIEMEAGNGQAAPIDGTLYMHRSIFRSGLDVVDGRAIVTSSILDRTFGAVSTASSAVVIIAFSAVLDDEPSLAGSVPLVRNQTQPYGRLALLASVLHRRGTGAFLDEVSGPLDVTGSSFGRSDADVDDGPIYTEDGAVVAATLDEFNSGSFPGCPDCNLGGTGHTLSGFVAAPCAAAVDPSLRARPVRDLIDGDLTPAYADFFGRCRLNDDDGIDVGPYEAIAGSSCVY